MTNFTHLITIFTNSTYTLFREVQETHANKLHNLGFAECCKELNEPNKVIINFSSYQLNDVEVAITERTHFALKSKILNHVGYFLQFHCFLEI